MNRQRGMTLIEVLVTVSLLSLVMASTLTLYSSIVKTNRQRDSLAEMISDADRILATVEQDIRNANSFETNYVLEGDYVVIAALPRNKNGIDPGQPTVVYAFDAAQKNRLFRVVVGNTVNATELSASVQSFIMTPVPNKLVDVELIIEATVAGETKAWRASSAFALK